MTETMAECMDRHGYSFIGDEFYAKLAEDAEDGILLSIAWEDDGDEWQEIDLPLESIFMLYSLIGEKLFGRVAEQEGQPSKMRKKND